MIWIIIGLLSFVLQIYILKNTWVDSGKGLDEFRWEHAQKIKYLSLGCTLTIPIVHDTHSQHSRIYYILDCMV